MHIVIADDETISRRLLRITLGNAGHTVSEAEDGEAAWELLQSSGATMLISDWHMPLLSGPELIRRIRATQQGGYIYTILLTARDSKSDTVAGLDSGADDYLTKPFNSAELRARVAIGQRIVQLESSLREARDRFAYQASHDALIGLLNRQAISEHVQAELARAEHAATPLSLALLDVDHFKAINDRHGHLVGDQALRLVAQTLAATVRPYDWVGRWGGEEFLVVLADTRLSEAAAIAERIRSRIAATTLPLPDQTSQLFTVSIGVTSTALVNASHSDAKVLFQQVDAALYSAKHAGRNRIVCADSGDGARD
jgi:two-component system, cell cycle response regulator